MEVFAGIMIVSSFVLGLFGFAFGDIWGGLALFLAPISILFALFMVF